MKKSKTFCIFVLISSMLLTLSSCKKDELQPGHCLFKKNYVVLSDLETTDNNNKYHIKLGRTTTDSYNWDDELITFNGPVGYSPLYNKATFEFGKAYQNEVMPDTTKLCIGCMQEKVIKKFLELKWKNSADDAFRKMRLAVSKNLYKVYPRLFEIFLTAQMEYLTGQIGGNPDWYGGDRNLEQEKNIALLFYKNDTDFQDPWECNCSPYIYVLDYYKNYVPGNNKSLISDNNLEVSISLLQQDFAQERYSIFHQKYGGTTESYSTKFDEDDDVYYLEIPLY